MFDPFQFQHDSNVAFTFYKLFSIPARCCVTVSLGKTAVNIHITVSKRKVNARKTFHCWVEKSREVLQYSLGFIVFI